jgi:outer membrane autotransporter protein
MDTVRHVVYSLHDKGEDVNQAFKSDPDGTELSTSIGGGYTWNHGGLTLNPYLRTEKIEVDIDRYREHPDRLSDGFGLALVIEDQDVHSVTTALGAQVSYAISTQWGIFQPHVSAEWLHEYSNDSRDITARFVSDPTRTAFGVPTERPDRDYVNLGLGMSTVFTKGKNAFISYEPVVGLDDVTSHRITGGVRFEF